MRTLATATLILVAFFAALLHTSGDLMPLLASWGLA